MQVDRSADCSSTRGNRLGKRTNSDDAHMWGLQRFCSELIVGGNFRLSGPTAVGQVQSYRRWGIFSNSRSIGITTQTFFVTVPSDGHL